jgi:ankyrin repeat protein
MSKGGEMRDRDNQNGLAPAFLVMLLMVVGIAAADSELRLVEAARSQDWQTVRTLLNQQPDIVNGRSDDGATALLWAAHWNDLETAELLIRAGADANAANDFRVTPLSQACTNRNPALVELFLEAGANPNTPIATGETPMMTCASAGSAAAVKMLGARGADVNATEPLQNQTALMWAASERHPEVVEALISLGADLQARTRGGSTALHFAVREGDLESTQLLLAAGVDVNIRSKPDSFEKGQEKGRPRGGGAVGGGARGNDATASAGSTPLLVATVRGQVPLALFLLEQGADPNVEDAGFTPLHWAAGTWEGNISNPVYGFSDAISGIPDRQGKLQLVKALLAHGADPNARMTQRPPNFAGGYGAGFGAVEDVGSGDVVGATPFLLASAAADREMMRLLLTAGADPHLVTRANVNALLAATALGRGVGESSVTEEQAIETVEFLLELGVDAAATTTFNENALFGPAYRGWNRLLELLIDQGADVNIVSRAEITPWLAASGQGDRLGGVLYNKEGADLLHKRGADPTLGKPCQAQGRCRPK